jgi:hypothetical protein
MSILTYVEGFPMDNQSLGASKVQIRNNLDGTFLTVGVDHINNNGLPGDNPAGYHNVIHIVPQGSQPAPVPGYDSLFTQVPPSGVPADGNSQLFYFNNAGGLVQLSGAFLLNPGFAWAGGILFQWGVTAPSDLIITPVSLNNPPNNFPFPNNIFTIQVIKSPTPVTVIPVDGNAIYIPIPSISKSGFSIGNPNPLTNGHPWTYTWLAIGN